MNAENDNNAIGPPLFEKAVYWRLKGMVRFEWSLWDDGILVASLKKVRLLRTEYMGSFDGKPVKITYSRRNDSAIFTETTSGQNVGEIRKLTSVFDDGEFVGRNGSTFVISFDAKLGYVFSRSNGEVLARTRFDNKSTFVTSFFTMLDSEFDGVNPWLIALASQFYAIHHAYGSP